MTEAEFRKAIVDEALTWVRTPYRLSGRVKGAGVNCAQLLFGVALGAGVIAADSPEPSWYSAQAATHSKEERLIVYIESYGAREIREHQVKPGDIVVYKTGKAHGHAAIVTCWPNIIHCMPPAGCAAGLVDEGKLARFSRRYFSLWRAA